MEQNEAVTRPLSIFSVVHARLLLAFSRKGAIDEVLKSSSAFSRRVPDRVVEELATVLTSKTSYEFKTLFERVHENLKARNAASGGEEMLRLRAYEKLQMLVEAGIVERTGKEYRGVKAKLATFIATTAAQNAEYAARQTKATVK